MRAPATPEDLDVLLEDAMLLGDDAAVAALFEPDAILVDAGGREIRGGPQIAKIAAVLGYVSDVGRVVQAGRIALVLGGSGMQVAHRSSDGSWRVAIMLVHPASWRAER